MKQRTQTKLKVTEHQTKCELDILHQKAETEENLPAFFPSRALQRRWVHQCCGNMDGY